MCTVCLSSSECDCPEENCDMHTGECLPEASQISECNISEFNDIRKNTNSNNSNNIKKDPKVQDHF